MQQSTSSPMPSEPVSGPSSAGSPWIPYSTTKHRVTKGRYITSNDPRGYIPVYEYPLNNQWVMMDVDDGYVLWTGIWKALGNAKADIVKMIESQPELESQLRRVRGGYLKIQGTWMPYEVALRLARRVAWPIRYDLVPLFGPTFPSTCLAPDQPGYGQVLDNAGRRRKRGPNAAARAAAAALRNQQHLNAQIAHRGQYGEYRHNYGYHAYPPGTQDEYAGQYPSRPPSPYGYDGPAYGGYQGAPAGEYGYPPPSPYGPPPGGRGYPPGPPPNEYAFPPRNDVGPPGGPPHGYNRRVSADGRPRYAPYPPASPTESQAYPPPSANGQYPPGGHPAGNGGPLDLPPISAIALGPSRDGAAPGNGARPMLDRSLPPIESLSREGAGMPPSMDTAAVLRRLRLEEHSGSNPEAGSSTDAPRSGLAPLGIARRDSGGPSEQYLQTRRRSASAPPPAGALAPPFAPGRQSHDRDRERRDSGSYDRSRGDMPPPHGDYPQAAGGSPGRYRHSYQSDHYPASGGGPARNAYHHGHHDRHHHPYAHVSSRPSSSSSAWTKQHSPTFDRETHLPRVDEPISPASSAPPPNGSAHGHSMRAHYPQRSPPSPRMYDQLPPDEAGVVPSTHGPFIGISHHTVGSDDEEMDEDKDFNDTRAHSSSFVRGETPRSPPSMRRSPKGGLDDEPIRRVSVGGEGPRPHEDDVAGSGLDALAHAAASASASQASQSPPHASSPTIGRRRGASDASIKVETPVRAPVRPW